MKPVRQVRKRDGRVVDFDEQKIADAIYKAALSVGAEDRFLAEELANVVTLFIDKSFASGIPGIEDVQDMVERVLIETGHARTAKAYILYREKHAKIREAETRVPGPVQRELFAPEPVRCEDAEKERVFPLDRESLARRLGAGADLPEGPAGEVAGAVLDRLRGFGLDRVPASLLGRLVDAELLVRGLLPAFLARGGKSVDREGISAALFPKEPDRGGLPTLRAGRALLRQFSIEELLPRAVASAHLEGRIHVRGLSSPASAFAVALSADAVRLGPVPGSPGLFAPDAVASPRRFAAHLGRVVRQVAEHVSHGVSLPALNFLAAPLLRNLDRTDLREEAWHLLAEMAGAGEVEFGLALSPPPLLAARKARGPGGEPGPEDYASFTATALEFAAALLDARGTGAGLGDRALLPRLAFTLGPDALEDARARPVIERAVAEGLERDPVLFVLDREDLPLIGTARLRAKVEDATRLTDTATLGVTAGSRAVVNLPRAALRAGLGNTGGFLAEAEAAADLALDGLAARERFLRRAAAGPDGSLWPFAGGRGEGARLIDPERSVASLAVAGLNEAVLLSCGLELSDSDEALKLGLRVLRALEDRCRSRRRPGFEPGLDAEEDATLVARFPPLDRAEFPSAAPRLPFLYSAGVGLRADAPVDLALRLDIEGRLAISARTSTVRFVFPVNARPSPESLLALLRKTWSNTRIRQLVIGHGAREWN
jgi:ribonucleoside-triphosphate reductase